MAQPGLLGDRIVAAEAPYTEVKSRSGVSLCVCVSGSDCVSVVPGVDVLAGGDSPAGLGTGAWVSGTHKILCVSELLRVWWSVRGCVCAYLSTRPLCRVPPLFSRFVRSLDLDLARAVEVNRRCLLCCVRPWCDAQATAARSALFVFGVCGCGMF